MKLACSGVEMTLLNMLFAVAMLAVFVPRIVDAITTSNSPVDVVGLSFWEQNTATELRDR